MSRLRLAAGRCARPLNSLQWIRTALALGVGLLAVASAPVARAGLSLAVAPFENEDASWPVARAVSAALADASPERLLAPGSFVADAIFEPSPETIRRWAYQAAVESVLVGRLLPTSESGDGRGEPGRRVEVVLHSGHSGAEMARHDVIVSGPRAIDVAAETLVEAILRDLGHETELAAGGPPSAAPSSAVSGREQGGGRGLDADFDLAGFRGDAPIEIKADEAEIVNRNGGRELLFQRNVFVRQANVTLRSDRLEASYDKGDSEPRKLVARGRVRVDQGDRHARCDRAVFVRDSQQLTCIGHAELIQGCDIVRGDSIRFDLARDRARVEGAASIVIRPGDETPDRCPETRGVL